jgi:hypothetical protein
MMRTEPDMLARWGNWRLDVTAEPIDLVLLDPARPDRRFPRYNVPVSWADNTTTYAEIAFMLAHVGSKPDVTDAELGQLVRAWDDVLGKICDHHNAWRDGIPPADARASVEALAARYPGLVVALPVR